jgi:hypothetical protein
MDIDKLLELAELPKMVLEGSQSFLNRLLGPTVDEAGQLLADQVRYRRFRNQVKIVEAARRLVVDAGLEPKVVALQTLVPLVEKASLEEEPTLQKMWANLLARAATSTPRDGLHRLCVEILAGISPREALILNYVYAEFRRKRPELLARHRTWSPGREEIAAEFLTFKPADLYRQAGIDDSNGDLLLDNLLRLNILRWEIPEIEDGEAIFPSFVHLTELGLAALKECIDAPTA